MRRFIGDEIEVGFEARPGPPAFFTRRGRRYDIAEILSRRRLLDFRKAWYRRRHRDIYIVRTGEGEVFRLYFYRGPGRKFWVLNEQLDDY